MMMMRNPCLPEYQEGDDVDDDAEELRDEHEGVPGP